MANKRLDGIQERKPRDCIREIENSDGSIAFKVQLRLRGHAPVYKTFTRRTDAKIWMEKTKTAMRNGDVISTEAERTTLKEALERYLREETPKKKGKVREARRVKAWMKHGLALRFLTKLRGGDFATYRDERIAEGKAWSTVRSELVLVSSVYKVAASEWKMDGLRNPIKNVRLPSGKTHGDNGRDRTLVGDEEQILLAQLKLQGPYYAPLAELAIETGMRQGELLSLASDDVDLEKRVAKLRDTKNSEPRAVPLSTRAVQIIRALPRPFADGMPLFPVSQDSVMRTFRAACIAGGIEDLKFHDLRHEAATRICSRLPMHEAMRVIGHKTPSMLMRYYNPKAEDLALKLA